MACPVDECTRPSHDGWTICTHHSWTLERDLGDIPALAEQLDITVSRQTASGARNGARSTERPLAFNYGASEAMYALRNTLVGWVRDLDPAGADWPADTVPALAMWLLARMGRLRTHPAAEEVVGEVCAAVRECWRAIDRAAERMYAGQCGAAGPEGECVEPLYARPDRAAVDCRACGATHLIEERRAKILAELADRLLTAREIARLAAWSGEHPDTARTEKLLSVWVARKRLAPHGVDLHGRPTYRFGEVRVMLGESRRVA